jgi:hypothetical protein
MSVIDAVDGSSTGIAMFYIAVSLDALRMAVHGTKQSFSDASKSGCFGVLNGSSQPQCLLSGAKQPLIEVVRNGCL